MSGEQAGGGRFVDFFTSNIRNELYEEIKPLLKDVRPVGDALAPRRTAEVIYEGEKLGVSFDLSWSAPQSCGS